MYNCKSHLICFLTNRIGDLCHLECKIQIRFVNKYWMYPGDLPEELRNLHPRVEGFLSPILVFSELTSSPSKLNRANRAGHHFVSGRIGLYKGISSRSFYCTTSLDDTLMEHLYSRKTPKPQKEIVVFFLLACLFHILSKLCPPYPCCFLSLCRLFGVHDIFFLVFATIFCTMCRGR